MTKLKLYNELAQKQKTTVRFFSFMTNKIDFKFFFNRAKAINTNFFQGSLYNFTQFKSQLPFFLVKWIKSFSPKFIANCKSYQPTSFFAINKNVSNSQSTNLSVEISIKLFLKFYLKCFNFFKNMYQNNNKLFQNNITFLC